MKGEELNRKNWQEPELDMPGDHWSHAEGNKMIKSSFLKVQLF